MNITNKLPLVLLLLLPNVVFSQNIVAKIALSNLPDNIVFRLADNGKVIDSAVSHHQSVSFKGLKKTVEPTEYLVSDREGKHIYQIFLESKSSTFTGTYDDLPHILSADNSQTQNDFKDYIEQVSTLSDRVIRNTDSVKKMEPTKSLLLDLKNRDIQYVKSHPKSIFNTQMLFMELQRRNLTKEEADSIFTTLDKSQKETPDGKTVSRALSLIGNPQIGEVAPDIDLETLEGKTIHLGDYKGKVIVLIFSDFNCPTSLWEIDKVIAVYNNNKKNNVVFIGINLDSKKDDYIKGIKKFNIPWLMVSDQKSWESAPVLKYGVNGVPSHFVINEQGKIIGDPGPVWDLESALNAYFKNKNIQ